MLTLTHTLRDLPYLFARSTYGNELTLHFGKERGFDHPKLQGKIRGSHVLSVRGSAWMLRSGIRPVVIGCGIVPIHDEGKPFNVTALESGAMIASGATVAKATPFAVEPMNSIGLSIELSDGSSFWILPTPPLKDDDDLPEPADWELLIPDKLLRVGPGRRIVLEDNSPKP